MMGVHIREAEQGDLLKLLSLYNGFPNQGMPDMDQRVLDVWQHILLDRNHHLIVGFAEDQLVTSCVIMIVPNLTHAQRPYALIENVITDEEYRNKGYATAALDYAKGIAVRENCYKIMLMTGSKKESTLHFYRKAGYNSLDKTAFVQWLE